MVRNDTNSTGTNDVPDKGRAVSVPLTHLQNCYIALPIILTAFIPLSNMSLVLFCVM